MTKTKRIKATDKRIAVQSNALIESSYKMSVKAKRVMLMLLGEVHPLDKDKRNKSLIVHAKDYAEKVGRQLTISEKNAHRDLRDGAKELQKTIVEFKQRGFISTDSVLGQVDYKEGEGWLEAEFTDLIKPHIYDLVASDGYTKLLIDEALQFRRFYTIRFYELLMQFRRDGERFIMVTDLKRVFQIPKKKYAAFSDFRKRVLEPSIKEIQDKTEWSIDYELIKKGTRIHQIEFIFEYEIQRDLFN